MLIRTPRDYNQDQAIGVSNYEFQLYKLGQIEYGPLQEHSDLINNQMEE